jgi:hypothetical protein
MTHTNGEDAPTSFNRPIPQYQINRAAPVDPTAHRLAEGGTIELNDRDRTALNEWFHASFQRQFQKVSWFVTDFFPQFFAPIRDRINSNFDKAFESIRAHEDTVVKLRAENATLKKEMHDFLNKKDREFCIEVQKLRAEIVEARHVAQKDCALQTEVVVDMMADRIRRELATEVLKMQNEVTEVRRGFDVQKIVADAARVTEEGFTRLKGELAVEITKSRDQMVRESRRATAAANPTPAATKPGSKKS